MTEERRAPTGTSIDAVIDAAARAMTSVAPPSAPESRVRTRIDGGGWNRASWRWSNVGPVMSAVATLAIVLAVWAAWRGFGAPAREPSRSAARTEVPGAPAAAPTMPSSALVQPGSASPETIGNPARERRAGQPERRRRDARVNGWPAVDLPGPEPLSIAGLDHLDALELGAVHVEPVIVEPITIGGLVIGRLEGR